MAVGCVGGIGAGAGGDVEGGLAWGDLLLVGFGELAGVVVGEEDVVVSEAGITAAQAEEEDEAGGGEGLAQKAAVCGLRRDCLEEGVAGAEDVGVADEEVGAHGRSVVRGGFTSVPLRGEGVEAEGDAVALGEGL